MIQRPEYGIAKTCFLTLEEAFYLASLSQGIIGLRSGIFEPLIYTEKNIPIICLYTKFKNRWKFKEMSSEKVLSGFTLKKLHGTIVDNIREFDVNAFTENDLIKLIINFIKDKQKGKNEVD